MTTTAAPESAGGPSVAQATPRLMRMPTTISGSTAGTTTWRNILRRETPKFIAACR